MTIQKTIDNIRKKFGEESVIIMTEKAPPIPAISTGSTSLDMAIGVGGFPRGRITEIFGQESSGKTTVCLEAVANATRAGEWAGYIDMEQALDKAYAEKIGVDFEHLLLAQPSTGEEALEIAQSMIESGEFAIVIIDSVAALVPRAEVEGEYGDATMGAQARLMGQAMRKMVPAVRASNTALVFINQLRQKIGVMYGCFHYDAMVTLADGTSEKIGKIVNQKLPVDVLSYDEITGEISPRKIVDWYNNGVAEEPFLQFGVSGGKSGRRRFAATRNHIIYTPNGPVAAGELSIGGKVLVAVEDIQLSDEQVQFLIGSGLGDGSLRNTGSEGAHLRICHGPEQSNYARWKHEIMSPVSRKFEPVGLGVGFDTLSFPIFNDFRDHFYSENNGRRFTKEMANAADARAIAIWYGDDGTFGGSYSKWGKGKASIADKMLDEESRQNVIDMFDRLGVGRPVDYGRGFRFSSEQTDRLHQLVAPFVHPNVDYKIHPGLRGSFEWSGGSSKPTLDEIIYRRVSEGKIVEIYEKPLTRNPYKYDLQIEGNHTYLVDGVIVHNSPDVTPGGNALKFNASVRLRISKKEIIKDGKEAIANRTRVQVVKNKCAVPLKEAEFDINYNEGISYEGDLLDTAVALEVVIRRGSSYSFNDERIGVGRPAAKAKLTEDKELAEKVAQAVREAAAAGKEILSQTEIEGTPNEE